MSSENFDLSIDCVFSNAMQFGTYTRAADSHPEVQAILVRVPTLLFVHYHHKLPVYSDSPVVYNVAIPDGRKVTLCGRISKHWSLTITDI